MAWGGTSDPQEFHRAYEWFSKRVPITKPTYLQMGLKWRRYAFTVAGVAQTQMVHHVWKETLASMEAGEHLREYKRRITNTLEAEWAGTVKDPPFRVQTIWRNAIQHAYNAGRFEMMMTPAVLQARPFWVFDAILDADVTEICSSRDSITLPATDPWWNTNYPPLHHRCRSAVRTATQKQGEEAPAERKDTSIPAEHPTQTGFGYRPGLNEWEPNPQNWPTTLRAAWDKKMKAMGQDLQPPLGAKPPVKKAIKKAKPPKAIHPDPEPVPPPPPKSKELHEIYLHEKIADAKGSNPGGIYKGLDGVERYVKLYDQPSQAYSEHISNHIYRLLGANAPESTVFTLPDGKIVYASKIIKGSTKKGAQTLQQLGLTKARADRVLDDYVADVLLANWDAVGLNLDNVLMVGSRPYRIDNGGSLLFRARGGRKTYKQRHAITEWAAFADRNVNPAYARVFKEAGLIGPDDMAERMLKQIHNLEEVVGDLGGWDNVVQSIAPHMNRIDQDHVIMMLNARTKELTSTFKERVKIRIAEDARRAAAAAAGPPRKHVSYRDDGPKIQKKMQGIKYDYDQAFQAVFEDPDLYEDVATVVEKWVQGFSGGNYQRDLRGAVTEILETGAVRDASRYPAVKDHIDAIKHLLETRTDRLYRAALQFDIPIAEKITVRRGVQDKIFLDDVYAAWVDDATTMRVRHKSMASWSYAEETAFTRKGGVTYEVDLDFDSEVFAAQFTDDSGFMGGLIHEHEVISMHTKANTLVQDTKRVRVNFAGKEYTWENRHEFIADYERAARNAGVDLPKPGSGPTPGGDL